MAQLAIAGAGALGSSALGFGWQAGWLIGATLGSVLFPPRGEDIVGPRVNDLSVTSSAYGQVIPIGFGTLRMGGNIIWAEEIRERKQTERVGKGGGGQTRTDYSYYGTWAVAFSAGPAQAVLRVWGDSKLIHDGGSSGNVEVRGARVSWYRGDEEQLPDPAIEADVGAGDVPGHRGMAYVVIEDLPLEDFGNRLPSVTAEIAFVAGGGVEVVSSSLAGEVGTPNEARVGVDWRRNRVFASATSNPGGLRVLRLSDMAQTNEATATEIFGDGERTNLPVVMASGRVVLQYGSGNTQPHALLDPVSLKKIGHFPGAGLFPSNSAGGFAFVNNACAAVVNAQGGGILNLGAGRQEFQLSLGGVRSDRMGILQVGARLDADPGALLHYQWHSNNLLPGRGIAFMPGRDNQGVLELHAVSETSGELGRLRFFRGELRSWETSQGPGGVAFDDDPGVLFPSDILPGASVGRQGGNSYGRARQMLYSVIDAAFVFYWQFDDANGDRRIFIVKWSHHSGLEWAREVAGAGSVANTNLAQQSRIEGGDVTCLLGTHGSLRAITLRLSDGGVLREYAPEDVGSGAGESMIYDSRSRSGVNGIGAGRRVFFGRDAGETVALSDVVAGLCARGGLGGADLDVAELEDVEVRGYVVGREASARRALEPLAQAYLFDAVESDGVLAFRKRGKPPVVQIGGADLLEADSEELCGKLGDGV